MKKVQQAKSIKKRGQKEEKESHEAKELSIRWSRRRRHGVIQKKPFHWKVFFKQVLHYVRIFTGTIILLLLFTLPYWGWEYFKANNILSIKNVYIHTNAQYFVGKKQEDMIKELLGQNFIGYDLEAFRERLIQDPWVKTAEVKRRMPDSVDITIIERKPVAIWNDFSLIENDGSIFEPDELSNEDFVNIIGSIAQKELLLDKLVYINQEFSSIGLVVQKIILDYRGSWTITLKNDVELYLGTSLFETRLRRFVQHYADSIRPEMNNIVAIDFRYDRGYALKWKEVE